MKKWLPLIIIVVVVYGIYSWAVGFNNAAVEKQETAKAQWANVESAYQRRADLIPNLVNTVKGYASHEKETLEGVINARAKATSTTIDPSNVTPEQMAAFQQNQSGLSSALSKLMVVVEKYPDLKANQNFLALQEELTSTENKISFSRQSYNDQVLFFNNKIEMFPSSIIAGMFNFIKAEFFELTNEAERAVPKVKF